MPSSTTRFVTPRLLELELDGPGPCSGAKMTFHTEDGGVTPYFGPVSEVPPLDIPGAEVAGLPLNLKPSRVFPSGITVFIPCPENTVADTVHIYGYDGEDWRLLCDEKGDLQPAGEGWLAAGWNNGLSRANLNTTTPPGVIICAYHFTGFAAVTRPTPTIPASESDGGGGGGGCFIDTLLKP